MKLFRKNKIKLSLIEDYINIVVIDNFNNNSFENVNFNENVENSLKICKQLSMQLKHIYNLIFEKLKMKDLSYLILNKELKCNNSLYQSEQNSNFSTINLTILKSLSKLEEISNNLKTKLKTLKFN